MSAVRVRHRPPFVRVVQAPGKLAPSFLARHHGSAPTATIRVFHKLIDYLARVPAIETNSTPSRGLGSGSLPQLRVHHAQVSFKQQAGGSWGSGGQTLSAARYCPPTELPETDLRNYITASLSSFAARNATFLLALMWMVSPVAGLRPSRAARLRTCRMPSPPMRMRSPFLRCLVTRLTRSPSTASVCFFDISWFSAKLAARCFIVTVGADFLAGAAMDDPPGCREWPPRPPITMVA